jgi:hypothetical protein
MTLKMEASAVESGKKKEAQTPAPVYLRQVKKKKKALSLRKPSQGFLLHGAKTKVKDHYFSGSSYDFGFCRSLSLDDWERNTGLCGPRSGF